MIKKYSEGQIIKVIKPNEDDEEKFIKKTQEAIDPDKNLKKEAADENEPFWINK